MLAPYPGELVVRECVAWAVIAPTITGSAARSYSLLGWGRTVVQAVVEGGCAGLAARAIVPHHTERLIPSTQSPDWAVLIGPPSPITITQHWQCWPHRQYAAVAKGMLWVGPRASRPEFLHAMPSEEHAPEFDERQSDDNAGHETGPRIRRRVLMAEVAIPHHQVLRHELHQTARGQCNPPEC
jgi:hypothetical protein